VLAYLVLLVLVASTGFALMLCTQARANSKYRCLGCSGL
jgi:hypothetical protein